MLFLLLLGCPAPKPAPADSVADTAPDSADTGCAEPATWYPDADGDGFGDPTAPVEACEAPEDAVSDGSDCDDTRAEVSPAGVEACDPDDRDEDCDGAAEELGALGEATWYTDADADGWGGGISREGCDPLSTEVATPGDCDDSDPATHPGAAPDCAGDGDQDCDGRLDAADEDGDGAASCRDCDDADPAVSPGAAERCATGYDDDCDGAANEAEALGCSEWYADVDGDGWGVAPGRCLCAPDETFRAEVVEDCDDADAGRHPDAAEVCHDGIDQDCDELDGCSVATLDQVFLGGEAGAELGGALSADGDLDGDGVDDLVLGARLSGGVGRVALYAGPVRAGMVVTAEVLGVEGDAALGQELVVVDLDEDGQDDLVVSAPYADHPHRSTGVTYVLDGPLLADTTPEAARFLAFGAVEDYVGLAVAAGDDWDGDGGPDLLLGSYGGGFGALLGFSGVATGEGDATTAGFSIEGDRSSDLLGPALDRVGDVDGDGAPDVVFGAPFADRVGWVGLVTGPVEGAVAASDASGLWAGTADRAGFGESVWGLPDMDGDGRPDVAVASHQDLFVLTGLGAGAFVDTDAVVTLSEVGGYLGESAVTAADLDGDGQPELVAGNAYWPDNRGAVLVYGWPGVGTLGPTDARAVWLGTPGDALGGELGAAGDVDGDGRADLVLGAGSAGHAAVDVGVGWLLPGVLVP